MPNPNDQSDPNRGLPTPPQAGLVIGQGSIGQRHSRILAELGLAAWAVSRRPSTNPQVLPSLATALEQARPSYVVIASATAEHRDDLAALAHLGFAGRVLVEKPLFSAPAPLPDHHFAALHVAYNLRYHPLVQRLRALCLEDRVCSAQVYVGQYLPSWRPNSDYRASYSAHAAQGGGVLRDLSHELDYLMWLVGDWRAVTAAGGQVSDLDIDSDDVFTLLMRTERCPLVSVQMNYLDRVGRREITINTASRTLRADLVANTLWVDGTETRFPPLDRDLTYRNMHIDLLQAGGAALACSLGEGQSVMDLIAAAEAASFGKVWVER